MEPASIDTKALTHRLAGEPGGGGERPRPRHPDPRARVRRLRHRVHPLPARASSSRTTSSSSASSRASTASARPTCRWCASSSRWAASPRISSTPSPTSSRSTCRCARATSPRVRTSRCTTCRSPTPRSSSASSATPACPRARAAATRCATSPATRARARCDGRAVRHHPYAGAYVRYFVRHPTTQAMPRKVKTAFTATDEDNAITQIHDMAFTPRERDGVRGVEVRVGGGTSIMPRLAPVLYEFVELDNGDYLKVTEACMRIFDRQDFLRVNRARARIKVLIDKIGIDAFRDMVEEELEGEWVAERDFSIDEIFFDVDEEAQRPRRRRAVRVAQRRPPRVRPLHGVERPGPAPGRVLHGRGQGRPRRPHPRAAARPGRDHAPLLRRLRPHHGSPEPGAALGARRVGLRGLAGAAASWTSARPAPTRSPTA